LRTRRSRNRVRSEVVLADLYLLSLQHEHQHPHSSEAIAALRFRPSYVDSSLQALAEAGMVSRVDGGWVINEAGTEEARRLLATNPTAPEAMLVNSLTEEGAR
ncbi:MAG TPA: hypothetical protein VHI31_00345, partial [Actinomycetota bacterium]|nr:hypothetical protein [Actinomycetota bacterium]